MSRRFNRALALIAVLFSGAPSAAQTLIGGGGKPSIYATAGTVPTDATINTVVAQPLTTLVGCSWSIASQSNFAQSSTTGAVTKAAATVVQGTYTPTTTCALTANSQTVTISSALSLLVGPSTNPLRTMQIGSAMRGPGLLYGQTSNGTDTAFNSVTWHYNESGAQVCSVAIVTPTWWTDTDGNGAERDMTGGMTITATIENAGSTRTAVTWSNSTSLTQAAGTNAVSDYVAIPNCIAAGAQFGVRLHGEVAAGVKWGTAAMVGSGLFQPGGKIENYESGAVGTITDKTASGTVTATAGNGYRVIGVLAQSASFKGFSLGVFGDSIAAGNGDGLFDGRGNTGWAPRAAGKRQLPVVQFGVTGTTAQANAASGKFARRADAIAKLGLTDAWLMWATNDLGTRTAAQTEADLSTIASQVPTGTRLATNTLMPRHASVGADAGQTIARQVIPTSGAFTAGSGSVRAAYNSWVRGASTPFAYYVELADAFDVNAANAFTRDGGYWVTGEPGGRMYLDAPYSGQVSGSPTTTSIPTNITKANTTSYFANYAGGFAIFSDGALRSITNNSAGTVTLASALSSAPAAGDAIALQSNRMRASGDAVHIGVVDNSVTGEFGGNFIARDVGAAKIQALGY